MPLIPITGDWVPEGEDKKKSSASPGLIPITSEWKLEEPGKAEQVTAPPAPQSDEPLPPGFQPPPGSEPGGWRDRMPAPVEETLPPSPGLAPRTPPPQMAPAPPPGPTPGPIEMARPGIPAFANAPPPEVQPPPLPPGQAFRQKSVLDTATPQAKLRGAAGAVLGALGGTPLEPLAGAARIGLGIADEASPNQYREPTTPIERAGGVARAGIAGLGPGGLKYIGQEFGPQFESAASGASVVGAKLISEHVLSPIAGHLKDLADWSSRKEEDILGQTPSTPLTQFAYEAGTTPTKAGVLALELVGTKMPVARVGRMMAIGAVDSASRGQSLQQTEISAIRNGMMMLSFEAAGLGASVVENPFAKAAASATAMQTAGTALGVAQGESLREAFTGTLPWTLMSIGGHVKENVRQGISARNQFDELLSRPAPGEGAPVAPEEQLRRAVFIAEEGDVVPGVIGAVVKLAKKYTNDAQKSNPDLYKAAHEWVQNFLAGKDLVQKQVESSIRFADEHPMPPGPAIQLAPGEPGLPAGGQPGVAPGDIRLAPELPVQQRVPQKPTITLAEEAPNASEIQGAVPMGEGGRGGEYPGRVAGGGEGVQQQRIPGQPAGEGKVQEIPQGQEVPVGERPQGTIQGQEGQAERGAPVRGQAEPLVSAVSGAEGVTKEIPKYWENQGVTHQETKEFSEAMGGHSRDTVLVEPGETPQYDRILRTLDYMEKSGLVALRGGGHVVVYSSANPDLHDITGASFGRNIWINADSKANVATAVMLHEFTHHIKSFFGGSEFNQLVNLFRDEKVINLDKWIGTHAYGRYLDQYNRYTTALDAIAKISATDAPGGVKRRLIAEQQRIADGAHDYLAEEMAANFVAEIPHTPALIRELYNADPKTGEKLSQEIIRWAQEKKDGLEKALGTALPEPPGTLPFPVPEPGKGAQSLEEIRASAARGDIPNRYRTHEYLTKWHEAYRGLVRAPEAGKPGNVLPQDIESQARDINDQLTQAHTDISRLAREAVKALREAERNIRRTPLGVGISAPIPQQEGPHPIRGPDVTRAYPKKPAEGAPIPPTDLTEVPRMPGQALPPPIVEPRAQLSDEELTRNEKLSRAFQQGGRGRTGPIDLSGPSRLTPIEKIGFMPYSEVTDPKTSPLVTEKYAIVTSWKQGRSEKTNMALYLKLDKRLQEMGYGTAARVDGYYGIPEPAFLVPGMGADEAVAIGRAYKQESILINDPGGASGLYFTTGKNTGKYHPYDPANIKTESIQEQMRPGAAIEDNYTSFKNGTAPGGGVHFQHQVDFNTLLDQPPTRYWHFTRANPQAVAAAGIEPRPGEGAPGQTRKEVSLYEAGNKVVPEELVRGPAKGALQIETPRIKTLDLNSAEAQTIIQRGQEQTRMGKGPGVVNYLTDQLKARGYDGYKDNGTVQLLGKVRPNEIARAIDANSPEFPKAGELLAQEGALPPPPEPKLQAGDTEDRIAHGIDTVSQIRSARALAGGGGRFARAYQIWADTGAAGPDVKPWLKAGGDIGKAITVEEFARDVNFKEPTALEAIKRAQTEPGTADLTKFQAGEPPEEPKRGYPVPPVQAYRDLAARPGRNSAENFLSSLKETGESSYGLVNKLRNNPLNTIKQILGLPDGPRASVIDGVKEYLRNNEVPLSNKGIPIFKAQGEVLPFTGVRTPEAPPEKMTADDMRKAISAHDAGLELISRRNDQELTKALDSYQMPEGVAAEHRDPISRLLFGQPYDTLDGMHQDRVNEYIQMRNPDDLATDIAKPETKKNRGLILMPPELKAQASDEKLRLAKPQPPQPPPPRGPVEESVSAERSLWKKMRDAVTIDIIPRLSRLGAQNSVAEHASAKMAVPFIVRDMLTKISPKQYADPMFTSKVAEVLNKDNVLAGYDHFMSRADALQNDDMGASIEYAKMAQGIAEKHNLEQYQKDMEVAKKDPELMKAIDNYKMLVQPQLEQWYGELKRWDPNTPNEGRGRNFGARINLLTEERAAQWNDYIKGKSDTVPESSPASYRNPNVRKDPYARTAYFTGTYSKDLPTILKAVVAPRYNEVTKLRMIDDLIAKGIAVPAVDGVRPESLQGKDVAALPIQVAGEGLKTLYVDKSLVGELRDALATDQTQKPYRLLNAMTQVQLFQFVDFVTHAKNVMSAVTRAQGAGNIWADVARKIPGLGTGDALARIIKTALEIQSNSPEIRAELSDMAKKGYLRSEHNPSLAPTRLLGTLLYDMDTASRVVMKRFFENLVERGLAKPGDENLRAFINQLGNYNARLMSKPMATLKRLGISPFIVAGRTYNRLGRQLLTGNPGLEATSNIAALQMRALNIAGTVALMSLPAMLNTITAGTPLGRPGTPVGAWDLGTDDEGGKHKTIDLLQLTGVRRGLRSVGANALLEGINKGDDANAIVGKMLSDVQQTATHPWTGPGVSFAAKVAGFQPDLRGTFTPNKIPAGGIFQTIENMRAALQAQNPTVYAIIRPALQAAGIDESTTGEYGGETNLEELGKTLLKSPTQAFGYKEVGPPITQAEALAHAYTGGTQREQMTAQEREARRARGAVVGQLRRGEEPQYPEEMTKRERKYAGKAAKLSTFGTAFLRLSALPYKQNAPSPAEDVWNKAPDEQKAEVRTMFIKKLQAAIKDAESEDMKSQLRALRSEVQGWRQ